MRRPSLLMGKHGQAAWAGGPIREELRHRVRWAGLSQNTCRLPALTRSTEGQILAKPGYRRGEAQNPATNGPATNLDFCFERFGRAVETKTCDFSRCCGATPDAA